MNRKRICTAPTPEMPDNLVPHPRYGTKPRFTDLEFRGDRPGMNLGWKYANRTIIPATGIEANTAKQHGSVMAIAIYFDVLKECIDCCRPFLFYAVEQKHWFEDLSFANDADCVRCVPCRKKEQKKERLNQEYQRLLTLKNKTPEERLELACLALDMQSIGRLKSLQKIRTCFNRVPESEHFRAKYRKLKTRMKELERNELH
jgi:hypothetical protein